jgi:hypothetical protein
MFGNIRRIKPFLTTSISRSPDICLTVTRRNQRTVSVAKREEAVLLCQVIVQMGSKRHHDKDRHDSEGEDTASPELKPHYQNPTDKPMLEATATPQPVNN